MEPRISIITLGVKDLERAFQFYHDGLGFKATRNPDADIIFFKMQGTCLALYPLEALAEDISGYTAQQHTGFSGITLAHNTRQKDEVDQILQRAQAAGGAIKKPAGDTSWGGYSGYFTDPDGHLWEVAYADFWQFNDDGSLVIP